MPHTSPATYLVWSILSVTLFVFLISHLWAFDRFRSLSWSGTGGGAFKRVMTFTYLLAVPLIATYSCGFAYIKYTEGWVQLSGIGIIPKPIQMWTPQHYALIFPFQMTFSIAWGFEIVTHLEELMFWMFLLRSTTAGEVHWFRSWHFRLWVLGSVLGAVGIPLVTVFKRANPEEADAWTFLIGSSASLLLTLLFLPVLFGFPAFLRRLKEDGAQRRVVLRLCNFHDINIIRVCFRFLFVLPLFVLGLDGVLANPVINRSIFWTDILVFLAGLGCISSSVMTLLIFFPRDLEAEAGYNRTTSSRTSSFGGNGTITVPPEKMDLPMRPHRPESAVNYEASMNSYERPRTPTSATPFRFPPNPVNARPVQREVVEADGAEFELYGGLDSRSNLNKHDDSSSGDEAKVPRVTVQTPSDRMPQRDPNRSRALYPPRGRFGGQQVTPHEQGAEKQRINPMLRHYKSPIDLMDKYSKPRAARPPQPGGNYV